MRFADASTFPYIRRRNWPSGQHLEWFPHVAFYPGWYMGSFDYVSQDPWDAHYVEHAAEDWEVYLHV